MPANAKSFATLVPMPVLPLLPKVASGKIVHYDALECKKDAKQRPKTTQGITFTKGRLHNYVDTITKTWK